MTGLIAIALAGAFPPLRGYGHGFLIGLEPITETGPIEIDTSRLLTMWAVISALAAAAFLYFSGRTFVPRHCQQCGYNLTGAKHKRCPECGQPFDPANMFSFAAPPVPWDWRAYGMTGFLILFALIIVAAMLA